MTQSDVVKEEIARTLYYFGVEVLPEDIQLVSSAAADIALRTLKRENRILVCRYARIGSIMYVVAGPMGWGTFTTKYNMS